MKDQFYVSFIKEVPLGEHCGDISGYGLCTVNNSQCLDVSGKGSICVCKDGFHEDNGQCLPGNIKTTTVHYFNIKSFFTYIQYNIKSRLTQIKIC